MFRFVVHSDKEKHKRAWKTTEKYAVPSSRPQLEGAAPQPVLPSHQPAASAPEKAKEPEAGCPSKKRKIEPKDSLANSRMKALQNVKIEGAATPTKSGTPDQKPTPPKATPDTNLVIAMRTAEASIKAVYNRVCTLTMRSSEIQHNVNNIDEWKWLSVTPQYTSFLKHMQKFEDCKQESKLLRRLLLAGGDLGHCECFY